jgi:hypothetical protein
MMTIMSKVTFVIPSIRTHNWAGLYESCFKTCKKHSWKLLFTGPFDGPEDLMKEPNIGHFKSYAHPTKAAQLAMKSLDTELLMWNVDDCRFLEDTVDEAIDKYDSLCGKKDVLTCRFLEGGNGWKEGPFWTMGYHDMLKCPGIQGHYLYAMYPLMNCEYFKELGGFDCQFEYTVAALHDLMVRVQNDGGKLDYAPKEIVCCSFIDGRGGDHAVIHDTCVGGDGDNVRFRNLYFDQKQYTDRIKIHYDNHKDYPNFWERRFNKDALPTKYTDLFGGNLHGILPIEGDEVNVIRHDR